MSHCPVPITVCDRPGTDLLATDRSMDGATAMILVTRLNGHPVALNCDLIERAEATPDTVLTLVDGTKYLLEDSVEDIGAKVRELRSSMIALAQQLELAPPEVHTLRLIIDDEVAD